MNDIIPQSICQIHYHNNTGGVTKVITRYAEIFNGTAPKSIKRNILFCSDIGTIPSCNSVMETINIKEANYHSFSTKNSFIKTRDVLVKKLNRHINNLPQPVLIIGHNLSLGKNCALSAAFAELIKRFEDEQAFHFFSVIHDLAEEGRITLLQQIRFLESTGIPVWQYLYPAGNVRYVVLNKRNYTLFTEAGFSTALLPNPLDDMVDSGTLTVRQRKRITEGLLMLSGKDHSCFYPSKPTFFYPVRVISRKNVLEAIILTCIIHKANLLIGGKGSSSVDKKLYDGIKRFSQRHRLPVVFDCESLKEFLPKNFIRNDTIFSLLYRYCDDCISTSVSEGFGFALYEPWLYGRTVIGRLPLSISDHEWCDLSHLYTRFDIPASWISMEDLWRHYHYTQKILGAKINAGYFKRFQKRCIKNGMVDFGILTQQLQFSVTEIIIRNIPSSREITKANIITEANSRRRIKGTVSEKNRKGLRGALTGRAYRDRVRECFLSVAGSHKKKAGDRTRFIKYFSSPDYFSALMTML